MNLGSGPVRVSNANDCSEVPPGCYEAWVYPLDKTRSPFLACIPIDDAENVQQQKAAPVSASILRGRANGRLDKVAGGGTARGYSIPDAWEMHEISESLRPAQYNCATGAVMTEYTGNDPFDESSAGSERSEPAFPSQPPRELDMQLPGCDKTTLMVRNLPISATQQTLLKTWVPDGSFDFLYMPFSFEKHRNLGYAFINFVNHDFAVAFFNKWHQAMPEWPNVKKPLEISWALLQGRDNNLMQFMNYKIARIKNIHYQPALFDGAQRLTLSDALLTAAPPVRF